jgi:hypothetical protein
LLAELFLERATQTVHSSKKKPKLKTNICLANQINLSL